MRKFFVSLILIFFNITLLAQTDSLVIFSVQSKKIADGLYELKAIGKIKEGWHLYGINPSVKELETIKFSFEYENAALVNAPVFDHPAELINDAIFKKVNVFRNTVTVIQQVKIKGVVPANLKGTINASLGKDTEFEQAEQPFAVNL